MVRVPTHRRPATPGEVLLGEFLDPLGITQSALAEALSIPFQRVNQIVKGKRAITPDTALRLARYFGTTAELWLNMQLAVDLFDALHGKTAKEIERIKPLAA
jgi:antitoxin HigA-1